MSGSNPSGGVFERSNMVAIVIELCVVLIVIIIAIMATEDQK